jgi:aminoglycoside phosphotransferase (APT) family kinase protein
MSEASADERRHPEGEGWDHVTWRVERADGPWIVKEAKDAAPAEAAAAAGREVAVMQLVRGALGRRADLAPDWVADARLRREGGLTYPRVPGVALQDLLAAGAVPAAVRRQLAVRLGRLIAAVGAIDPSTAAASLPLDDAGWAPWFEELPARLDAARAAIPPSAGAAIERFAEAPRPPFPPPSELVLCHNDLGGEHVLVDPATWSITGIIDWTDAAVGDPAADVGRLVRDLGREAAGGVLDGMAVAGRHRASLAERAHCYARLLIVEDLAYALEHRPDLVESERTNLLRLYDVGR